MVFGRGTTAQPATSATRARNASFPRHAVIRAMALISRLRGPHDGPRSNHALTEDLGAEPAAMNEPSHHARPRELLEMLARFAEPHAPHQHGPDPESPPDQVTERDACRGDVAPRVRRRELAGGLGARHPVRLTVESLDRLDLDEGHLAPALARPRRVEADPQEI